MASIDSSNMNAPGLILDISEASLNRSLSSKETRVDLTCDSRRSNFKGDSGTKGSALLS